MEGVHITKLVNFGLFFGCVFFKLPRAPLGAKINDFSSQNEPPKLQKWCPRDPTRVGKCNKRDPQSDSSHHPKIGQCLQADFELCRVIPKKIYVKVVLRRCSAQRVQSVSHWWERKTRKET